MRTDSNIVDRTAEDRKRALPDPGRLFILAVSGLAAGRFTEVPRYDDFDPMATRREAAMFYGLFLRGHSADDIRKDITIPKATLKKWLTHYRKDSNFRESLQRVYEYRRQVLAIFDELVTNDRNRLQ